MISDKYKVEDGIVFVPKDEFDKMRGIILSIAVLGVRDKNDNEEVNRTLESAIRWCRTYLGYKC